MKRCICFLLAMTLLLAGCSGQEPERKKYTATFLTLFDTVTSIVGFAESEEAFQETAQQVHDDLLYYHQLFDIYQEYEGIANLKTINDSAAVAPVKTEKAVIDLLLDCKAYYTLTGGKVNAAMGSVLALWHEARNEGIDDPRTARLPDQDALEEASRHTDFDRVIIDEAASTVFITDPDLRLDVGAIAKGWSVQKVCETAPEGLLISVGGNVCATGPKQGEHPWVIGIQNPDGGDYLHTIYVESGCVVTSGDYQRTYTVEGKQYHHIIDPDTLMPAAYWRSVSIVCQDSALADALSTALFLLPLEDGRALAEKCGADVLWIDTEGNEYMTPGFENIMRT
jgi:thiamine biosynthesis lipoprotein